MSMYSKYSDEELKQYLEKLKTSLVTVVAMKEVDEEDQDIKTIDDVLIYLAVGVETVEEELKLRNGGDTLFDWLSDFLMKCVGGGHYLGDTDKGFEVEIFLDEAENFCLSAIKKGLKIKGLTIVEDSVGYKDNNLVFEVVYAED